MFITWTLMSINYYYYYESVSGLIEVMLKTMTQEVAPFHTEYILLF